MPNFAPAPNHNPTIADIQLKMPTLLLDFALASQPTALGLLLGRQEGVFEQ